MKKILFGCGREGRQALLEYGEDVSFFVDNNKVGEFEGIPILSFEQLKELDGLSLYDIIICTVYFKKIEEQLKSGGGFIIIGYIQV